MAGGGFPTRWGSAVPASLNSLTPDLGNASSDGHADIATSPGVSSTGRHDEQHSAISNLAQSSSAGAIDIPDHVLHNPQHFDDTPYVPPRVTQAELQTYSALDPIISSVYPPPHHDIRHQYLCEGGNTSPSESHHSVESHWSNSSSSSASSQRLSHDYLREPTYHHVPPPPRPTTYSHHYPAYHGQRRHGLEHLRHGQQPLHTGTPYYLAPPQGYSIDGLLSPEIFDDASTLVTIPFQPPHVSTFPVSPTPVTDNTPSDFRDAGPYLRQQLALPAHAPVGLHSLPDPLPGEKPSIPLPMLVKLAIYGSPNKQLTLQEIYLALENRFQWFRDHKNEKAWKNSIRHNLSLNKVFQRVARPITEPGKGSYWRLDMSGGEGYKRARKRRPKNRIIASEEEDDEASEMGEDPQSPPDLSQHTGIGRSSITPIEDAHVDSEPRSEGHVVGEGRTRSTTRRAGGGIPYPSQSPRYQQGTLPVVTGQDAGAPGQPLVRFGQPTFGQSSFPTLPQTRPMPVASSSLAAISSSPMTMAPTTSTVARLETQRTVSRDQTVQTLQTPPSVVDTGGLPAARRVKTHLESQQQSQRDGARCNDNQ